MKNMWEIMASLAEEAITRAMREGAFDNLEGAGRPLRLDDDSHVPPDLRMAYKILKNAGFLPPELEEEREIERAVDLLSQCRDEQERYRQIQKLNLMITRMNLRAGRAMALEKNQLYYEKVLDRVPLGPERSTSTSPFPTREEPCGS